MLANPAGRLVAEPSWLPDGRTFLYTELARIGRFDADLETAKIRTQSATDPAQASDVTAGYHARYASPGRLVFMKANAVYSMPFDPASRTVSGSALAHFENVAVERVRPLAGWLNRVRRQHSRRASDIRVGRSEGPG